jgi:hypothetical protein
MIRFVAKLTDQLVRLDTEEGPQLWTRGRLRKTAKCAVTLEQIVNGWAWRPLTNLNNRWTRISDEGMRRLRISFNAARSKLNKTPRNST